MLCLGMHSNAMLCIMVLALQDSPLCSSNETLSLLILECIGGFVLGIKSVEYLYHSTPVGIISVNASRLCGVKETIQTYSQPVSQYFYISVPVSLSL